MWRGCGFVVLQVSIPVCNCIKFQVHLTTTHNSTPTMKMANDRQDLETPFQAKMECLSPDNTTTHIWCGACFVLFTLLILTGITMYPCIQCLEMPPPPSHAITTRACSWICDVIPFTLKICGYIVVGFIVFGCLLCFGLDDRFPVCKLQWRKP